VEYYWKGEKVKRADVVKRTTVIPWALWVGRSESKLLPRAVWDEVMEFAMPQMVEDHTEDTEWVEIASLYEYNPITNQWRDKA
jgi:hypothetical protein